jgi:hypothetical protein
LEQQDRKEPAEAVNVSTCEPGELTPARSA